MPVISWIEPCLRARYKTCGCKLLCSPATSGTRPCLRGKDRGMRAIWIGRKNKSKNIQEEPWYRARYVACNTTRCGTRRVVVEPMGRCGNDAMGRGLSGRGMSPRISTPAHQGLSDVRVVRGDQGVLSNVPKVTTPGEIRLVRSRSCSVPFGRLNPDHPEVKVSCMILWLSLIHI